MTPIDARRISVPLDSLLAGSTLTLECLVETVRRHPLHVFRLPFWAMRGRAFLQRRLAESADLDVAFLPYRDAALEELRRSVKEGARAVLVTTADPALARRVAGHLGIAEVESGRAPDSSAGKDLASAGFRVRCGLTSGSRTRSSFCRFSCPMKSAWRGSGSPRPCCSSDFHSAPRHRTS